jgi:hypothetical protein
MLEGAGLIVLVGGLWWGVRRCCGGRKGKGYSRVGGSGDDERRREEEVDV